MNHFCFLSLEPTGCTQTVTYMVHGQICTSPLLFALLCSGTWAPGGCCFVKVIKLIDIHPPPASIYADKPVFLHYNCVKKIRVIGS